MPKIKNSKIIHYNAKSLYNVVSDIARYPEILKYIQSVRILKQSKQDIQAEVTVGVGPLHFSYECTVLLQPSKQIDVVATSGPFKHLTAQWVFTPLSKNSTKIDYSLDSQFNSALMELTAGAIFSQQLHYSVSAFEDFLRKS